MCQDQSHLYMRYYLLMNELRNVGTLTFELQWAFAFASYYYQWENLVAETSQSCSDVDDDDFAAILWRYLFCDFGSSSKFCRNAIFFEMWDIFAFNFTLKNKFFDMRNMLTLHFLSKLQLRVYLAGWPQKETVISEFVHSIWVDLEFLFDFQSQLNKISELQIFTHIRVSEKQFSRSPKQYIAENKCLQELLL